MEHTNHFTGSKKNCIETMSKQPLHGLYVTLACHLKMYGKQPEEGSHCGATFWYVDVNRNGTIYQVRFYDGYSGGMACTSAIHFMQDGERLWRADIDEAASWYEGVIPRDWAKIILTTLLGETNNENS